MSTHSETSATPLAGGVSCDRPDAATYHRRWFLIDEDGGWIDDAELLRAIKVDVRLGHLVLSAEGMLRLDFPLEVIEDDDSVFMSATVGGSKVQVVNEGEVAATWMGKLLGRPARLVKLYPADQVVDWPA